MKRPSKVRALGCLAIICVVTAARAVAQDKGPVIVVETSKGSFSLETYPDDAPLTVAHVVGLVRARFYDGQRVHRALPGFVVQFGDPQSRDLGSRDLWGRGAGAASGHPIGVAEITKKRTHRKGAVAAAHMGDPAQADSQIYIALERRRDLDGHYAVFGQVIAGQEVVEQLRVGDVIIRMILQP